LESVKTQTLNKLRSNGAFSLSVFFSFINLGIVTRKGENSKCGQECFSVPGYIEEVEFLELKKGKMPQSEA
jgi:hypothetical protein